MPKVELSRSDTLLPSATKRYADPGPSCQPTTSSSSPIAPEQSLFTPPPPARRRTRIFIDYVDVPPLPKGLTKAGYQPMSHHSTAHSPVSVATGMVKHSPVPGSSVKQSPTPSFQGRKGKERERDVASSDGSHEVRALADRAGASEDALIDAFYGHVEIPLKDEEAYPPLTSLDLSTNSRFHFTYAWRGNASRLREAELDCVFKFRLPEKVGVWARSVDTSASRMPGTAGYVSIKQLRSWKLAPSHSPHDKSAKYALDEQAPLKDHTTTDANVPPLPENALPIPITVTDPTPSTSVVSHNLSSTAADIELDINRYFNGLSDSPSRHDTSRHHIAPAHTLRPQTRINTLGLVFPSFELDPLACTDGHESFLGVPPSPTPTDTESSRVPGPTPCSPFESASYFPASPSNLFGGDASLTDVWPLEQGEGLRPDHDSSPVDNDPPTVLGTIDPSLLGPGQLQPLPVAPKDLRPKRRSKLPEPIVYIRRPVNSSTLPQVSGKRPVQIKYRDAGGSPATSSAQIESNDTLSNHAENPIELSTNDMNNSPLSKRCSVPSLKLREYRTACDADSDYVPKTSKPKSKPKPNRPSIENRASVVDRKGKKTGSPPMSFCHQCRHTSLRPKMSCSNIVEDRVCGKRFCNRCICNRYPDITFDEESEGFLCPACTGTCNCSVCSRNRGEEFISMRLGGLAASVFKTKVTLVRDVGEPPKSPSTHVDGRRSASETTPAPEPGTVSIPSHFWAHVYGMEGERVGSAFMTREHMERLRARGPLYPPPPSISHPPKKAQKASQLEKKREKIRRPRVFVGRPLASWKVRKVRDLEPSVDVEAIWGERMRNDAISAPVFSSRRRRCYVGNPASLHESYGRMPRTMSPTPSSSRGSSPERDSDGSLTPLSELEAGDWPQPAVGECCSWAPPGATAWPLLSFEPPPGAMGGAELDGRQGQSSGSGSGTGTSIGKDVMDMGMGMAAEETGPSPVSMTALSQEEMARAISAALAALSVGPVA